MSLSSDPVRQAQTPLQRRWGEAPAEPNFRKPGALACKTGRPAQRELRPTISAHSRLASAVSALLLGYTTHAAKPGQPEIPEPLSPPEAARSMIVPAGFHVDLVAAEPDVRQPIGMCVDDRGRIWIAEAYSYPKHSAEARDDRILILEDKDADGRFETRKVFYDKLNYITGIEVGFGGVWVMSPPYFYFIPDKNGDDVPDSRPQILLDGFGNHANSHNLANGFAWGPDGWLYATHGRTNWSTPGKPGTPTEERTRFDGGVWRYHPVRHVWEPYADGCTNPWGIDWNDHGQGFIPNTVNPHLFHVIQGAHYEPWRGRESSKFAYQRIRTIADHLHYLGGDNIRAGIGTSNELELGGGHSHCGILVYLGDNWPDRYRNTVFLHNTHGRRINHDLPHRKDSGYTATHGGNFLISKDPWLMGVSFQPAPDGSVYFTDWSDTGECHSVRNTRKQTGRVYRIRYGKPEAKKVDIASLSNNELVQLQLHKNDWHVRHARRVLHERATRGDDMKFVQKSLRGILNNNPDITRKLRALWSLRVTGGTQALLFTKLLSHESEHLRAWAITLLCERRNPSQQAMNEFVHLANKGNSQLVRLHLASALQRVRPEQRWSLAEALLARTEDVDDHNLPLMYWYGIEPLVDLDLKRFLSLAAKAKSPLIRQFIARRAAVSSN